MALGLGDIEMQIFDGIMLSDGHLSRESISSNARLSLSLKHRDFAGSVIIALPCFSWTLTQYSYLDKRTEKIYHTNKIRTSTSAFLTEQHDRWYPHGRKEVPKDIVLGKHTLLWWYLGDGSLEKKKIRPNFRRVSFATMSFTTEEINFLICSLKTIVGEHVYNEGNRIMISRDSITQFQSNIAKNCANCYEYKFDFGQYSKSDYLRNSYFSRPLDRINQYRHKHKVREFDLTLLETE